MKIRKLLGYFGIVFVGLSFLLTPSLDPKVLLSGHAALERITEASESTEDKLAVEGLIAHSIALGNQHLERKMLGLGVIALLSIFLIRKPRAQNQSAQVNPCNPPDNSTTT